LDTTAREALEVAAVIGQDVPLDVWQACIDVSEDQLGPVVQEALEQRLLEEFPDGAGWRFTHALVREALHEGIPLICRRRWHRRVAETLAALPASDPDLVAYQFQQAGDSRATDWLIEAGERAQRSHAWFSAADRFEAAVGLLEAVPERDRERGWLLYRISQLRRYQDNHQGIAYLDEAFAIASACGNEELAAAVLQGRGLLKCFAGDLQTGLADLEAGVAAAERLGIEAAGRVRPGAVLNRGVYALWLAYAGRFHDAVAMAQQQLSQTAGPLAEGGSYRALGVAHSFLGQPNLARPAFVRSREIQTATHDPPNAYLTLLEELTCVVLHYQADNLAERARLIAEADVLLDRAKGSTASLLQRSLSYLPLLLLQGHWDQARDLAADPELWGAPGLGGPLRLMWAAVLSHHQAPIGEAWRRMHELLSSGPAIEPGRTGISWFLSMQHLVAQPAFDAADLEIARPWLAAFDRWLAWSGAVLGRAENAVLWAQYHQALGELSQARERAERAFAFASNPRQPLALIAARRVLGQLDTLDGRYSEADQHLRASLALADACVAPYERALALLALAELRVATDSPNDARALLGEVVTLCEPLEARAVLTRAEALLADLNARRLATAERGGLSAREIEVLRLVAQGMIDREIAAALFISPRTVTTHVTHILDKLGVSTRTEAAAYALREGII
jgi:DNA-binding CsgD family transcriptional regulator